MVSTRLKRDGLNIRLNSFNSGTASSSSFSTDPPSRIVITSWITLLSTTTRCSGKASPGRTEENRSLKLSIDAAHPSAAASLSEIGSLGYYNGSEVTRQEKDVPPTVQNTTSSVSAETLYSLLSRLANNRRHCDEGPSYRSRAITITWGMRSDLSKRIQFNMTLMVLSCAVL